MQKFLVDQCLGLDDAYQGGLFAHQQQVYVLGNQADVMIHWKFSGTFLNLSLVYKICNSLYLLIGLQRNTLYSKSNQRATPFLRHYGPSEKSSKVAEVNERALQNDS